MRTSRSVAPGACALAVLVAACAGGGEVGAAADAAAVVQRDVGVLIGALYSGQTAVVVDYTHPVVLEGLGGREKAFAAVDAVIKKMLESGLEVESFEYPRPPVFVAGEGATFAIVPTRLVLKLGDQRVESLNYQFGIRENGATRWRYAEGSRVNADNVRSLFPGFPDGYAFPPSYRRRL